MRKNGSGFRTQACGSLLCILLLAETSTVQKQLCAKEPVTPHHGSGHATVAVAAIAAAVIAGGYKRTLLRTFTSLSPLISPMILATWYHYYPSFQMAKLE